MKTRPGKPPWLRLRLPSGPQFQQTRSFLKESALHTVCQEACCPNIYDCFARRTATFLILGDRCTRQCTFCAVRHGPPRAIDPREPDQVARAVAHMDLGYVVITSVTRDDLPDGGAAHFAATIAAIRSRTPKTAIELLIPDFQGVPQALQTVLGAGPQVLNHNLETVPRLYPQVRPQADYERSLAIIEQVHRYQPMVSSKSGVMLGLGETRKEILLVLQDLRKARCRILTMGQYLQPSANHHPVVRYVHPDDFHYWRSVALDMGFAEATCSPLTRSSYRAREVYERMPEVGA